MCVCHNPVLCQNGWTDPAHFWQRHFKKICLSSVFCCRAGSGYPNGYPVLGNSWGGFPLPSSQFVIRDCDQSFPSPWHCLSTAPSLSGATLLSILEGIPYPQPGDAGGRRSAPAVCQICTCIKIKSHSARTLSQTHNLEKVHHGISFIARAVNNSTNDSCRFITLSIGLRVNLWCYSKIKWPNVTIHQ